MSTFGVCVFVCVCVCVFLFFAQVHPSSVRRTPEQLGVYDLVVRSGAAGKDVGRGRRHDESLGSRMASRSSRVSRPRDYCTRYNID